MNKMKAFVTGATGFAGSHLCAQLLMQGHEVTGLLRDAAKKEQFHKILSCYPLEQKDFSDRLQWVEGDLSDLFGFEERLTKDSVVFHTAGMVSFQGRLAEAMYDTNVVGTREIVNLCLRKNVKRLIHYSSTSAVAKTQSQHKLITEETPFLSDAKFSAYGKTKYLAELEVQRAIAEGLDAVIINPGVIIGPGNWKNGTPSLFNLVYKGLPVYSSGLNGFVSVEDVSHAAIELAHSGESAERYILVSENLTFKALFDLMSKELGTKAPSLKLPENLTLLAGHIGELLQRLGLPVSLSRDYTRSSIAKHAYSSEKYRNRTGKDFKPMALSIQSTAQCFLKQHQSNK